MQIPEILTNNRINYVLDNEQLARAREFVTCDAYFDLVNSEMNTNLRRRYVNTQW